jgi:hypothetical protein
MLGVNFSYFEFFVTITAGVSRRIMFRFNVWRSSTLAAEPSRSLNIWLSGPETDHPEPLNKTFDVKAKFTKARIMSEDHNYYQNQISTHFPPLI